MNDLERYFRSNEKRLIHKFYHYFDIYDRHFSRYRNKEVVILEIGVFHGGSLQMWKDYFGPRARIYGIDILPDCKKLEEENVEIFIGSQTDRKFLRKVKESMPPIDILIDDGGHTMEQQKVSFEELFDHIREDGIYLCEDLHTSYFLKYGGGYKRRGTFIEYSKKFIDYINAWFAEQNSLNPNSFSRSVDSVHYYTSIVVIEKRKRGKPESARIGNISFTFQEPQRSLFARILNRIKNLSIKWINKILRFFRLPGFVWK